MKRKCRWCGREYDTSRGETSIACDKNPRGRNYRRRAKRRLVRIGVMMMGSNPWARRSPSNGS